ncbi:MAG: GNAT family N-acetyltransferase [Ruminococcus flavefaciens]|nr:GNAT family N-acetyltransferase [Ruminococcus flavefaciens]MCM1230616.1 GNAT family N-acetyltransferase [Ruminococcus flavefaciens]
MHIRTFEEKYQQQVTDLILAIQNDEAGINLSIDEQPDLLDINACYRADGSEFWVALSDGKVIGTIALMNKKDGNAVLKKFFVDKNYRGQKIGLDLYRHLLDFAEKNNIHRIVLDTPSVAEASHRFYEKSGFMRISRAEMPFPYDFPDRDSLLYLLEL